MNAVLDASFWINAHEIAILDFLVDYFTLFAPQVIVDEIAHPLASTGTQSPAGKTFQQWLRAGNVTVQNPTKAVDWFQRGENAAVALAQEQQYWLLIDDQHPYHRAKAHGLTVVGSADFVLYLHIQGRLSFEDAARRLRNLPAAQRQVRRNLALLGELARARGESP
ncbi:MAG: hypothetical protein HY784_10850 [Chloroflexi bacterium]|nr:hypothetical protein [Chloroflexota bacterium]